MQFLRHLTSPKGHFNVFLGSWPPEHFWKRHVYRPPCRKTIISTRQGAKMPPPDRATGAPRPEKVSFSLGKTHIFINRHFPFKEAPRGHFRAIFLIRVAPCLHFVRALGAGSHFSPVLGGSRFFPIRKFRKSIVFRSPKGPF